MPRASAFFLLAPWVLGACTEATPNAHPPPKPAASLPIFAPNALDASASMTADASAAPVVALPDGKPTWSSIPTAQNGFYVVLDGLCSKLGASPIGTDAIIHYGGTSMYSTERTGAASFIALRAAGLESIGAPGIDSPTGIAGTSLDDFWIADSTGTRTSAGAILHRRLAGTWKTYQKDETNIHTWLDGGIIGTGGFAASNGEIWVEGSTTKPPGAMGLGLAPFPRLAAFPSGDVAILALPAGPDGARAEGQPWLARHWSPKAKMTRHSLPWFPTDDVPSFVEVAPDELYAYDANQVVQYDGTSWKLLAKTTRKDPIAQAKRAAKGEVWVRYESGAVERSTPTGFVAVPTPEPIASMDGIDKGAPWAIGVSGKLYKRTNGTWSEVKLPVPAFGTSTAVKAKIVKVGAADDVLVIAAYWEKGAGWTEQELHQMVIRTKVPRETMRCNEPDPENNNVYIGLGFQSWPPLATAACKTPFVVLARRSKEKSPTPTETDWKAIRGALKGHGDLGDGKLVEFVSGDRTFLGAKAKDVDSAKKIAALAAAKDRLRPEVVCGAPPATTREVALE